MGLVLKRKTPNIAKEVMQDHAQSAHESLKAFHHRFFTTGPKRLDWGKRKPLKPRDQARSSQPVAAGSSARAAIATSDGRKRKDVPEQKLDLEGMQDYRRKVRVMASDGGPSERRALFVSAASDEFPNVQMVIKDMMHCIRIATQKPLHLVGACEDVFTEIINKKHALLPDIMNSHKWQTILEAAQEEVLRIPALDHRGTLKQVLKHLAFAKQRMDSCADPLAKVCMMLMPIGVMLSLISSDERNAPDQRSRAIALLSKFKPKFMHAMGVSADWGLISEYFLRRFDDGSHDISNSVDEEEEFITLFDNVFVKGGVFHKISASDCVDAGTTAEFMTERVRKQCQKKCVFRCGDKQQVVWGAIGEAELKELAVETRVAAEATVARIRADMAGARRNFQCFSLKRIGIVFGADKTKGQTMKGHLVDAIKKLAAQFQLDRRLLQIEYNDAIPVMLKHYQRMDPGAQKPYSTSFRNLTVWEHLLDARYVDRNFPERIGPFIVLPELIRIWISICDGESTVERDFSHVRNFVRAAKISNDSYMEAVVILKLSGPKEPHEMAVKSAGGEYVATQFTLRCAAQWRLLYGARCGIGRDRPRPKQCSPRASSFANVKRSVIEAARRVTRKLRDRVHSGGNVRAESRQTRFGVPESFFCGLGFERKEQTSVWNNRLQRFSALSRTKKSQNQLIGRFGRGAFPRAKLLRGCSKETPFPVMRVIAFEPTTTSCVSDESYKDMGLELEGGRHRCRRASLFVVDSLECFHGPCPTMELVICILYVVARGIPVTTVKYVDEKKGNVQKLHPRSFVKHNVGTDKAVEWSFDQQFKQQFPDIVDAVHHCTEAANSKWKVVKPVKGSRSVGTPAVSANSDRESRSLANDGKQQPKTRGPQKQKLYVETLSQLWGMLQQLRSTINSEAAAVIWMDGRVVM